MKLRALTTKAIRALPDRTYSFATDRAGLPQSVVLIAGGPRTGKSAMLEAISAFRSAVGSSSPVPLGPLCRAGADAGAITTEWVLEPEEQRLVEAAEPVLKARVALTTTAVEIERWVTMLSDALARHANSNAKAASAPAKLGHGRAT